MALENAMTIKEIEAKAKGKVAQEEAYAEETTVKNKGLKEF